MKIGIYLYSTISHEFYFIFYFYAATKDVRVAKDMYVAKRVARAECKIISKKKIFCTLWTIVHMNTVV